MGRVLRVLSVVAVVAAAMAVASPQPVLADARPVLVSVTLDDENHAVVTWTKQSWQGSTSVRWSTGDGKAAIPDANWDAHYGAPLVDCNTSPNGPAVDGVWSYGKHCHGQDVANDANELRTRVEFLPGRYYFQVMVAGESHYSGAKCSAFVTDMSECLTQHYSNVIELTVVPAPSERPTLAPPRSEPPNPAASVVNGTNGGGSTGSREIQGPGRADLPNGAELDLARGTRAKVNLPYNLDVSIGEVHMSDDLAIFDCPKWMEPQPDETTMVNWVGVRCRTVTTPQAAAMVRGTDFTVSVSSAGTTFHVYAGQIDVSDLGGNGLVALGPGQMTIVRVGRLPTPPVAFDTEDASLRWWGRDPDLQPFAVLLVVGLALVIGFVSAFAVRRTRRAQPARPVTAWGAPPSPLSTGHGWQSAWHTPYPPPPAPQSPPAAPPGWPQPQYPAQQPTAPPPGTSPPSRWPQPPQAPS